MELRSERNVLARQPVQLCLGVWQLALGIAVVISTLIGVVHAFTEVPYMDQWNGYIGFWQKIQQGDMSAWWEQHNEHRIIFSRLLFWLDIKFFGGANIFLVAMNVVLQALLASVFVFANLKMRSTGKHTLLIVGAILAMRFSWMQGDNWSWGFQSGSIAVYLFAAVGFATLSLVSERRLGTGTSLLAGLSGMVAAGTLSNGLLVLPLLTLQAIFLKLNKSTILLLAIICITTWIAYFIGYEQPPAHVSLTDSLLNHLLPVLNYFVVFIGGPAFFAFGSTTLAAALGTFIIITMLGLVTYLITTKSLTPYRAFLIAIFGFAAGSALAASLGRWSLGIETAEATRYMTPALTAWLAFTLIIIDLASAGVFLTLSVLLSLVITPSIASYQRYVLDDEPSVFYARVGILSLKLGVNDLVYTDWLFPRAMNDTLTTLADYAMAQKLSAFHRGWLLDTGTIKYSKASEVSGWCSGSFDTFEPLPSAYRVHGWVSAPGSQKPIVLIAVDGDDNTVGYGISGDVRPDVDAVIPGAGAHTGWVGYVKQGQGPVRIYAYRDQKFCPLATLVNLSLTSKR